MQRLCALISGSGSTMLESFYACRGGPLEGHIEPALVIASKDGIGGIQKARDFGLPDDQVVVCGRAGRSPLEYGEALLTLLVEHGIDLIAQLGWLPMTPLNVVEAYEGRSFNQHPAPLDPGPGYLDFGGVRMHGKGAHCARLYFARRTGDPEDLWTEATVHRITGEFDKGAVIGRRRVDILPSDDDPVSLVDRVLPVEHKLVIETLLRFAMGEVVEEQRETRLILPGQEGLLAEAKEVAELLFPKG